MKLPNGFGSVYKMQGNRRKPYRAVIFQGYSKAKNGVKSVRTTLGYYETKKQAIEALTAFNEDPYDLKSNSITFAEVYEKWGEEHFKTLNNKSAIRTYTSAFNHSKPLHDIRFRDIKAIHLEKTIADAEVGNSTKARMKSMYNLMFRFAIKHDIVEKNYAELTNAVKVEKQIQRIPFTSDEIGLLWLNITDVPFVDMILVGIYSGFRPNELATLKIKDVYLDDEYIVGGSKTDAGRNRVVPIHPEIKKIILDRYDQKNEYLFNDYNKITGEVTPLTYDRYRRRFEKVMETLNMNHHPHETRHTFITQAKLCGVNDFILKRIVGHEVRDITEGVYTHRNLESYKEEMVKIKF